MNEDSNPATPSGDENKGLSALQQMRLTKKLEFEKSVLLDEEE